MTTAFVSRRVALLAAASAVARVCEGAKPRNEPNRLSARPGTPVTTAPAGLFQLKLRPERDGLLYISEAAAAKEKAPLVVALHGSSRAADRGIQLLKSQADEFGFLLLAPASADHTWDVIKEQGGATDVGFIDACLAKAFQVRAVDPARIAIAGMSDGASCALSVGLTNGDLFSAVLGFSPGFIPQGKRNGKPPVFLSHGTKDTVFPVDGTRRRLVSELKHQGYQVTYREFEGAHTLPKDVASDAMRWFTDLPAAS